MTKYEFLSELANLFDKYLMDNPEYEDVQQKFEYKDTDGKKMQAGVSTYRFLQNEQLDRLNKKIK